MNPAASIPLRNLPHFENFVRTVSFCNESGAALLGSVEILAFRNDYAFPAGEVRKLRVEQLQCIAVRIR